MAATSPPPSLPLAAAVTSREPTDLLTRIRTRAGRSIDRTFGEDAPLARALLIADQRQIPTEMRDRYASAGLIHMLSISGLHVAVIAAAMELLFQVASDAAPSGAIRRFRHHGRLCRRDRRSSTRPSIGSNVGRRDDLAPCATTDISVGRVGDWRIRSTVCVAHCARCRLPAQCPRHVCARGGGVALAKAACEADHWTEGGTRQGARDIARRVRGTLRSSPGFLGESASSRRFPIWSLRL